MPTAVIAKPAPPRPAGGVVPGARVAGPKLPAVAVPPKHPPQDKDVPNKQ